MCFGAAKAICEIATWLGFDIFSSLETPSFGRRALEIRSVSSLAAKALKLSSLNAFVILIHLIPKMAADTNWPLLPRSRLCTY